jgi:hypothetical protein
VCVKIHQEEGKVSESKSEHRLLNYIGLGVPTLMVLAIASMYSVIPYVFHGMQVCRNSRRRVLSASVDHQEWNQYDFTIKFCRKPDGLLTFKRSL